MSCVEEYGLRKTLEMYIKQTPEQNLKMFEKMDKEERHGTWFYPLWSHSQRLIDEKKMKER